jgi:hypothetical protein
MINCSCVREDDRRRQCEKNIKSLRFRFTNPRNNLPAHLSSKRGETNFASSFKRTLSGELNETHAITGQFPLSGYGIADMVVIQMGDTCKVVAFEFKLKDWKRGMIQAYRYSYFANKSILVLPSESIEAAKAKADAFVEMGIGLWEYNQSEKIINEIYTPASDLPKNASAHSRALQLLNGKLNLG